jgi:NADH dehydrogenase
MTTTATETRRHRVAIVGCRHVADTIVRRLGGDATRRPFRYRDLGTMATISRFSAISAS